MDSVTFTAPTNFFGFIGGATLTPASSMVSTRVCSNRFPVANCANETLILRGREYAC